MTDFVNTAQGAAEVGAFVQHGDHVDTIESVDAVFREQRKLSFAYGAVFFLVTLAIPLLTVSVPAWYTTPVWGGFTLNYLFVSLLYYVFLWVLAWTYIRKADKLDERLLHLAEEQTRNGAGVTSGG
ncbi:MAG: DUF485 domain-containing protein [Coriobacteriia bacterium]|nr:DUF485 domain-containing protein [Coriobacteriia bacterium]